MKNADLPAMPFTQEPFAIGAISNGFGPMAVGLTKREMFAMAAMQGIMGNSNAEPRHEHQFKNIAEDAVRAADALLAELERTK